MAKRDDEVERLRREIRELKSLNRQLLKQVKKLNKGYRKLDEDDSEEEVPEITEKEKCPNCQGKIKTLEIILANKKKKVFKTCEDCGMNIK